MEKEKIYIGIDHGNHLVKSANFVMENGVKKLAAKPTFVENTLVYQGSIYKVGEERTGVKDSKLSDDDYYILTLAVFAKEAKYRNIPDGSHIILSVGLPLKQFATERGAFIRYLKREGQPVQFRYEGITYRFYIDKVLTFPQCYSAVADRLPLMKDCLIVDIGSWTIDIMEVRNGIPIESRCETFTESLVSVIQDIRSESSEILKKELPERCIISYIMGDKVDLPKKYRNLMDAAMIRFTERIGAILKENGHDTDFADVVYVGGGATVMKRYGKYGNNTIFIEDVKANAIGYESIARQVA